MNDIIVTGATSIIGVATVAEALTQGNNVAAVVRENSPRMDVLQDFLGHQGFEIIKCDMQNYRNLNLTGTYDAFLHLAWQNTFVSLQNDVYKQADNILCTLDAIHAAHRVGCSVFVIAGSQAEYGRISEKMRGDTACNPESGYGIAKYAAGRLARLTASQLGMRCCHTRILSTYGEGMDDNTLIVYLIKTLLAGEKPLLTKCEQIWDFLHVRDVARAILAVSEKGLDGKTYPIGSGDARPLREYVEMIRDIIDPSIALGFGEKEYYPHQPMILCADIDELRADTGFNPGINFMDGINMTIEWVKTSGGLPT
jgi:nucleoside-diphosphate-sugar epimerase